MAVAWSKLSKALFNRLNSWRTASEVFWKDCNVVKDSVNQAGRRVYVLLLVGGVVDIYYQSMLPRLLLIPLDALDSKIMISSKKLSTVYNVFRFPLTRRRSWFTSILVSGDGA